jgi:hypothetical protein
VTVTNPDGNRFVMNIQNPLNNQLWASPQISTNATAGTFENAIRGYYSLVWGAPISVAKQMFDSAGNLTTNVLNAARSVVYKLCQLLEGINQISASVQASKGHPVV